MRNYELAARMQLEIPKASDLTQETAETLALYGVDQKECAHFARGCLLARRLIEHGRMRAGITAARGAIESDPSDAETYLLLGAALQETGQWKEATATFSKCLERATRGPKLECRALRGR